jgi:DNA-damage-inducible protein D
MNEASLSTVKLFQSKQIRSVWDATAQKWYFAIVDVIAVLTGSVDPGAYWRKLKERLKKEGNETVTNCHGLKITAADGKKRLTDVADTEQLLRLIQSIPSPKAEPFKRWLARVGFERLEEIGNPELAMDRMKGLYEKKGYPKEWIDKRLRGIAVRQDLTGEWKNRGARTSIEYAILTNEIMQGAFDLKVEDYKLVKGLEQENLRDHMTDIELILTMLGEATTTKLHRDRDSKGFEPLKKDAQEGGAVAGSTRKDIEKRSGKPVVTSENYKALAGKERKKLDK